MADGSGLLTMGDAMETDKLQDEIEYLQEENEILREKLEAMIEMAVQARIEARRLRRRVW